MHDAKTRKWQVKIRNLTKEQIDFISGPRLLPTLSKADAVVIEHGNTPPDTEETVTVELNAAEQDTTENNLENKAVPPITDPKNMETRDRPLGEPSIAEEAKPANSDKLATPKPN